MSSRKVAIVTGGNKGIGYAIVKGLCQKFDGDVYLTARNVDLGLEAVNNIQKLGFNPKFHVLDITCSESIQKLKQHIMELYGGIDILVNNAAIAFKVKSDAPFSQQAEETIRVNYFGVLNTCTALFPSLRAHARVVNLSSSAGHLSKIPGKDLRQIFSSPDLDEKKLSQLMLSFVESAKDGTYISKGWPNSAYVVSKVGVSALSRIQQLQFSKDKTRPDIIVNHVHPGYVDTDMTSHKGPLTIEQGAEAPLFAALLPHNCETPKGDYIWYTKEIIDWVDGKLP